MTSKQIYSTITYKEKPAISHRLQFSFTPTQQHHCCKLFCNVSLTCVVDSGFPQAFLIVHTSVHDCASKTETSNTYFKNFTVFQSSTWYTIRYIETGSLCTRTSLLICFTQFHSPRFTVTFEALFERDLSRSRYAALAVPH